MKRKEKTFLIITFIILLIVSMCLWFINPIINNQGNETTEPPTSQIDPIEIEWPIINTNSLSKSINDYNGFYNKEKFKKIFEFEIISNINCDYPLQFEYIFNDVITVNVNVDEFYEEFVINPKNVYLFQLNSR